MTNTGESGGESAPSPLKADIGSGSVYEELNVAANKLMRVAAPPQMTGTGAWNCYLNYGDPPMYSAPVPYPQPTIGGNYFFWDRGHTRPVFAFSPGGTTISAKGTLENGKNVITEVTELAGLASLWQLLDSDCLCKRCQHRPCRVGCKYDGGDLDPERQLQWFWRKQVACIRKLVELRIHLPDAAWRERERIELRHPICRSS